METRELPVRSGARKMETRFGSGQEQKMETRNGSYNVRSPEVGDQGASDQVRCRRWRPGYFRSQQEPRRWRPGYFTSGQEHRAWRQRHFKSGKEHRKWRPGLFLSGHEQKKDMSALQIRKVAQTLENRELHSGQEQRR